MPKPVLEIDGARFDDLEGFWDGVSERLVPGPSWGRNPLLEIIRSHGRGGDEAEDGVILQLD